MNLTDAVWRDERVRLMAGAHEAMALTLAEAREFAIAWDIVCQHHTNHPRHKQGLQVLRAVRDAISEGERV